MPRKTDMRPFCAQTGEQIGRALRALAKRQRNNAKAKRLQHGRQNLLGWAGIGRDRGVTNQRLRDRHRIRQVRQKPGLRFG
ncbi:hypothetical protein AA0473_0722 [Acetobacter orleanensis NRIC 0473]|nr:hypothetical protein AA0473_0722 [Acetobacter orleanensis NRIC 0473]